RLAPGDDERHGPGIVQLAFGEHLRHEGADRTGACIAVAFAVAHADVEDRGGPAVVPRAEAARAEVDVRHQAYGEGREESDDVEGLVDEQPVDHRQVLGVRAAADEELAAPIARRDDAGEGLDVVREVAGSGGRGEAADLGGGDALPAELSLDRAADRCASDAL